MIEIRSTRTGGILHTSDAPSLRRANLHGADLYRADL
jgi:hypothetical protein